MDTRLLRHEPGGAVAAAPTAQRSLMTEGGTAAVGPVVEDQWALGVASDGCMHRALVLIVDDDSTIRALVALMLEMAGYATVCATDGADALAVLEWISPEAIVTDMQMPQLSGTELCRAVRASPRTASIPIVIFTGSHDDEVIAEVQAFGGVVYVDKADGTEGLLCRLAEQVAGSRVRGLDGGSGTEGGHTARSIRSRHFDELARRHPKWGVNRQLTH